MFRAEKYKTDRRKCYTLNLKIESMQESNIKIIETSIKKTTEAFASPLRKTQTAKKDDWTIMQTKVSQATIACQENQGTVQHVSNKISLFYFMVWFHWIAFLKYV